MPITIDLFDRKDFNRIHGTSAFLDAGAFSQQAVEACLAAYVPPGFLWPQPLIASSSGEIELTDVLFWHSTTALAIECKARKIQTAADLHNQKKLTRWLDTTLSHARTQVELARSRLVGEDGVVGRSGAFTVLADLRSVQEIIPIVIVFEVSDFFWNPKILERKLKYPGVQLFDLRGFFLATRLLPSVSDFLAYLTAKQALSRQHPAFIPYEENLLLYFLVNGRSLAPLQVASSAIDAFAQCTWPPIPSAFLFNANVEDIYAALGLRQPGPAT